MTRQTVSFLRRRFQEVGLQPDTRHGQNFLVDLNLIDFLARSAELSANDVVLEIGTGMGSLTGRMAAEVAAVVTVEIDAKLQSLAREELHDASNIVWLKQDALKNKNRMAAEVLEAVNEQLGAASDRRFKLAANLPYNVATPIISNLLRREPTPDTMTVTIQKELADRIVARPSTKDYGALSVWVQTLCDAEILRVLPPSVFWPRPKVHSAIIQLTHRRERREAIPDLEFFHIFVRSLFFHRRKFLRSVLVSAFKGQLEKPQVDAVMDQQKLGANSRAEELDVAAIQRLCEAFRAVVEPAE